MVTDASRCSSDDTHRICKCGAGPRPDGRRCLRQHPYYGGELSWKTGEHSTRPVLPPIDADVASMSSAQVQRLLAARIRGEVARSVGGNSNHRMSAREQAHALNMLERLGTIESRIREMDAASPDASTDGEELPGDWPKRLAIHFANQPDQFGEFIMAVLLADRERCGPLRSQTRLTLDHLAPQGVPKFRGRKSDDDPDTVLL